MRPPLFTIAALLACLALVAAGCGGGTSATSGGTAEPVTLAMAPGSVPASASLAPADATAYVTIVSDPGSKQWADAGRLIDMIPGARGALDDAVRQGLEQEGLEWQQDIEPVLGPELVVVVTKENRPILLMKTPKPEALVRLLEQSQASMVTAEIEGWTAAAEKQADLDAYRASLAGDRLDTSADFRGAMDALPGDAIARAYVNGANLTESFTKVLEQAGTGTGLDLSLGTISGAIALQDNGVLFKASVETPGGEGGAPYEPQLFRRVPGDALAVISFGGTQKAVAQLRDSAGLGDASKALEEAVGLSLDGIFDLFSGEGVIYVREGATIPEVTAVLAPGDVDGVFETIETLVQRLAEATDAKVATVTQDGVEVKRLDVDPVNLSYARLDDVVIVTTGASGIRMFNDDGDKLVDNAAFQAAAATVGLGERTAGFLYVDVDGLIPLIEGLLDLQDMTLPDDARQTIEAFDSVMLQASGDGRTTTMSGFVRLTG